MCRQKTRATVIAFAACGLLFAVAQAQSDRVDLTTDRQDIMSPHTDLPVNNKTLYNHVYTSIGTLRLHYTVEEQRRPKDGEADPLWGNTIKPDAKTDFATVDEFVQAFNDAGYHNARIMRSTVVENVVHLILYPTDDADRPLDRVVSVEYSGVIGHLPDHLGTLTDGTIQTKKARILRGSMGDFSTETRIKHQDASVRDILTQAVPRDLYPPCLWTARWTVDRSSMEVDYSGPKLDDMSASYLENGLEGYLQYLGDKFDCYFTIEDDRRPGQDRQSWIADLDLFDLSDDASTLEELVRELDATFNGRNTEGSPKRPNRVQVLRSKRDPRVIHLIASSLPDTNNYALNESASLEHEGKLEDIPAKLGRKLEGRIGLGSPPTLRSVGGLDTDIRCDLPSMPVRDLLTAVRPRHGTVRLLWHAGWFVEHDQPVARVGYFQLGDGLDPYRLDPPPARKRVPRTLTPRSSSDPFTIEVPEDDQ